MTKRTSSDPYGCANKERAAGYWAKDGLIASQKPRVFIRMKWVDDVMSVECRYDMSLSDPRCGTCRKRGDGEKYDFEIRSKGR
jgi:hypothetical protein